MVIRKATKEDAAVLAQNQVRMALESENIVLEYPMVKKGTDAYLADEHRGTAYIAEIDGMIAGSLLVTREWSDWGMRGSGGFRASIPFLNFAGRECIKLCTAICRNWCTNRKM